MKCRKYEKSKSLCILPEVEKETSLSILVDDYGFCFCFPGKSGKNSPYSLPDFPMHLILGNKVETFGPIYDICETQRVSLEIFMYVVGTKNQES